MHTSANSNIAQHTCQCIQVLTAILHNTQFGGVVCVFFVGFFNAFLCRGTMTTHAESINSDLQRGLDRRLRHTQH